MTYELKLDQADVLTILKALGELPLKVSVNTFGKVQQQVNDQDQAAAVELAE